MLIAQMIELVGGMLTRVCTKCWGTRFARDGECRNALHCVWAKHFPDISANPPLINELVS